MTSPARSVNVWICMATNKSLISRAWTVSLELLRKQFWPLLILFAVSATLGINLEDSAAELRDRDENLRLTLHAIMAVWDFAEGILLILILSWGLPSVLPLQGPRFLAKPFDRKYLNSFFAEYLRVLGQTILWGLLLILPGFVMYALLTFVPFITLFSADYEAGQVDALELSLKLVKNCMTAVFVTLIGTTILQGLLEVGPSLVASLHTLPIRITALLLSLLISIWTYSLMVLLFKREIEKPWNLPSPAKAS